MMTSEFFEQQEGNMCALHAVRNLVGNDKITKQDFEQVVDECVDETKLERDNFATPSGNYTTDVVHRVLNNHGFDVERVSRPLHTYLHDPSLKGFVVHDDARNHFTAVRFNAGQLKHFDSMQRSPQFIRKHTLEDTQQWTLMAVKGNQRPAMDRNFLKAYHNI